MSSVRLLAIERLAQNGPSGGQAGDFDVQVHIEVAGRPVRHRITVRPRMIAGFDASLLIASEELQAEFQEDQATLYRLCKLVGEQLRGLPVRVPQAVAA